MSHQYEKEGSIIEWDIKSYYAYLPATFVEKDISLEFLKHKQLGDKYWPVTTPTGKYCIMTTMGLSFLYSPFFLTAHAYASVSEYEADGYSLPYRFALTYSTLFYFILGMIFLRKVLRSFFSETITAITILLVGLGTNLFFYTVIYGTPMSHAFNFFLITLFVWQTIKWYQKKTNKLAIFIGLTAGLIVLIRPTNITVLLIFIFWQIRTKEEILQRLKFYFTSHYILLMALFAILVWIPQLAYWKYVSGQFLYFSYGAKNESFFFCNPQICKFLISFRKGWFVYTPIMFVAVLGFFPLYKKNRQQFYLFGGFILLMIFILSSWWCWWFGGGYGQRSMIDFYGIMAIPLATLIEYTQKKKAIFISTLSVLGILTWYNYFQIKQYTSGALHYDSMTKKAYFENFLRKKPTAEYWKLLEIPDYDKAREGIYVEKKEE